MPKYSQGSIRKKQKYDGSWEWEAHVSVTFDDGTRKSVDRMTGIACDPKSSADKGKRATGGRGHAKAREFLTEFRDELVAADAAAPENATNESVVEFVERYQASRTVEESTASTDGYLLSHIAMLDMPVSELKPRHIEQWKLDMDAKGVGREMQNKSFTHLKSACKWGVGIEDLVINPCDPVKAPAREKRLPTPLDPSELPRLTTALKSLDGMPDLRDLALFSLNCGMRRGELCALRWHDVDGWMDGSFIGFVHVNNVIACAKGGTYLKPVPKNGHRRGIDINDALREILDRRRKELVRHVSAKNIGKLYVFSYGLPETWPDPGYFSRQWSLFSKVYDFRSVEDTKLRLHDLRDTFATAALVNGVPVVTVAAILGHSNPMTTYRHYSHFIPSKNKETMDLMNDLLNAS